MHCSSYLSLLLGASLVAALPAPAATPSAAPNQDQFPINDGFPNPSNDQLQKIFRGARGTLPNTPIPKFHPDTFKSLQIIATNEQIEVSLYEICLLKIKNGTFGPENFVNADHRQFVIDTFEAFYQQEEVHALIGQGGLQANGQQPISPSQYQLKTDTYQDCLTTANILGDNVLGTSQGVINQAIAAGDGGLAAQLDSLIAQEGQQSGFLRSEMVVNGKHNRIPGAMPAYTASTREFLFSLLEQNFIKPGTDKNKIDLPVFLSLSVQNQNINPVDQTLSYKVNLKTKTGNNYKFISNVNWDSKNLYLAYISGQNSPFYEPIKNVKMDSKRQILTFDADFPAYTNIINAFAVGALVSGNNATTAQEVTSNTVAGPATIELTN
ncbi:hypothetical protein PRZ48_012961 [Zasmidium cellare]|uniref:Uncharacterized protein n=1 Tax=Zasmidium cellare TaxID=395010 RepID=A0ABR0E2P2_ZASCE|nr:hypothetical protein PRZ48_012961 [Zasmidium cellare]